MKGMKHLGFLVLCALLGFMPVGAFPQDAPARRGDDFTIKIAVAGPGDELYFWWGHIALVIEDRATGQSRFYDYGLFSFENEHFFTNFAMGRLYFSCGVSPTDRNLWVYQVTNRTVTFYTLNLSAEAKERVRDFAEINVRPENRNYFYHHFNDNCATRIRDIIDIGVNGQFKEAYGNAPGRFTLRQHVRRHTWFNLFFDWLLNFLMGQGIDTPITVWAEMFLPQEIGDRAMEFSYLDSQGVEQKLVSSVETMYRATNRPAILAVPRRQWPRELALSFGISAVLCLFYWIRGKRKSLGQALLGISQGLLGLFLGGVGSMLFFMTFFSNHDYTYHNSNILFVNPLLLAALPLGIIMARGDRSRRGTAGSEGRAERFLAILWGYVFLGGIATMAIKLLPSFYQQNQVDQALVMPIAFTLCAVPVIGKLRGRQIH